MRPDNNRNEFSKKTKDILAKRAGYLCSICRAKTTGPSLESIVSITSIGVAAHMAAASIGGPRYDPLLTHSEISSILNAIWLCQNHATMIDRDRQTYTIPILKQIKYEHEEYVRVNIGIPITIQSQYIKLQAGDRSQLIIPMEYGFLTVGDLIEEYKMFINPILHDKELNDNSVMGVLMCGSQQKENNNVEDEPLWTVFVNKDWLEWVLKGQASNFKIELEVPNEQIYGQIPGCPESFFEFLIAMVQTNTTFEYKRQTGGYLALLQRDFEDMKY